MPSKIDDARRRINRAKALRSALRDRALELTEQRDALQAELEEVTAHIHNANVAIWTAGILMDEGKPELVVIGKTSAGKETAGIEILSVM